MFGLVTKAAVEQFQSMRPADPQRSRFVPQGLQVTGVVDQNTWAELMKVKPEQIKMVSRESTIPGIPSNFPSVDQILSKVGVPAAIRPFAKRNLPLVLTP